MLQNEANTKQLGKLYAPACLLFGRPVALLLCMGLGKLLQLKGSTKLDTGFLSPL